MKVYEDKTYPAHTEKTCVKRTCDLCGKEADGDDWNGAKFYTEDETTISVKMESRKSKVYGNEVDVYKYEVDLCPKCFKDRFIVWLKEQGAKIEEEEFHC